jgi:hypothetical protein
VSNELSHILCPPLEPLKSQAKRKTKSSEARRLTSNQYLAEATADEKERLDKEMAKVARKEARLKAREEREQRKEAKKTKGKGKGKGKTTHTTTRLDSVETEISMPVSQGSRPVRRTARESLRFIESVLNRTIRASSVSSSSDDSVMDEDDTLCAHCHLRDPQNGEVTTNWIDCELCNTWFHRVCTGVNDGVTVLICPDCLQQ